MKTLRKILPYIVVIIAAVVSMKIVDRLADSDTTTIDQEKIELQREVEDWKTKYKIAERGRIKLKEENKILLKELEEDEIENDTVIADIRDANTNREFSRLDSLGEDLLDRLRRRR